MTCRSATVPRLRLSLCDRWDVVLDPARARLRAKLRDASARWLVCHVDGIHARRSADGTLTLSAQRLLVSVDGGDVADSGAVLGAVDDLLDALRDRLDADRRVDAEALPLRMRPAPRARRRAHA